MSRDRSLDEFFGEPEGRTDGESDPPNADGATREEGAEEPEDEAVSEQAEGSGDAESGSKGEGAAFEPIATTYRWSAEGGICGVCDERVESRWHAEGAFVCADCKEW